MRTSRGVLLCCLLVGGALIVTACNVEAPASPEATSTAFVFPTATAVPESGSISGRLWHDLCAAGGEGAPEPETAPVGCVALEGGGYGADGVLSAEEPGIEGVSIRLGEGVCPSFGLATATTDGGGGFRFEGLSAGTYCLSVDASAEGNASILIPGGWTFPISEETGAVVQQSVTLSESAVLDGVNFGWDFQFLPEATAVPGASPTATPEVSPTPTMETTGTPEATLSPDDPKAELGEPRFEDELESAANWTLYENDQVEFTLGDDRIDMKALKADFTFWWTLTGPSVEDFYVEGEIGLGECSGRDEVGLVVRSSEIDDEWVGYLFAVTCDGRYTLRIWDGETVTDVVPLTDSEFVPTGSDRSHRLGLLAEGETFTLYIDGNRLTQVTDSTYEDGLVGVFIGAGATPGFEGYLERIALWDLP